MNEPGSLLKADLVTCACGCGVEGRPRVKAWRDSLLHNRNCRCHRCLAPTYRKNAAKRERKIARDTGGTRHALSGALSGVDVSGPLIEIEETFNQAIARGIRRWWESKTVQAKVARLFAHSRMTGVPAALVIGWDRRKRLAILPYEDLVSLCQQRLELEQLT